MSIDQKALEAVQSSLAVDGAVVITKGKVHETKLLKSTAGASAIDMSGSPIRAFVPGGMGSVPENSILTYIDGNPADSDIAKLMYLGVPIADLANSGIPHERMVASFVESALYADDLEVKLAAVAKQEAAIEKFEAAIAKEEAKGEGADQAAIGKLRQKIEAADAKRVTAQAAVDAPSDHSFGIVDSATAEKYRIELAKATIIDPKIQKGLEAIVSAFEPEADTMDMLSALTSYLNAADALEMKTPEQRRYAAVRATAVMPVLVGLINSHINGNDFWFPLEGDFGVDNEDFDYAKNVCQMLGLATDEQSVATMNTFLLLHLDHEMNASTTAVKGTMSADSRMWAGLTSGVQTLHGKRHGGANFDVLQNLDRILVLTEEEIKAMTPKEISEIKQSFVDERMASRPSVTPEEAKSKISTYLDKYDAYYAANADDPAKFLIPGIGHRVYKKLDPRADVIKKQYEELTAGQENSDPLFLLAKELEAQTKARGYGEKGLFPNVDFYSGLTARFTGINARIMTPMFAVGRVAGWCSQALEHASRAITRPFQLYVGQTNLVLLDEVLKAEAKAAGVTVEQLKEKWLGREDRGEPDATKITDIDEARELFRQQKDMAKEAALRA